MDLSISVVIVNWNSRDDLRECLEALSAQVDRAFETIVVDNGSSDGSIALVEAQFPDVRLVATGENLGFAEGCNRGIEVARGAWIATLNNDACPRPEWIAELRRALINAPPNLGMLQSKMLFKSQRMNSSGILLFSNGTAKDRSFDQPDHGPEGAHDVFCPTAGAALYRRSMLDARCSMKRGSRRGSSIVRSSCTSKTWIWGGAVVSRVGAPPTCRRPWSSTRFSQARSGCRAISSSGTAARTAPARWQRTRPFASWCGACRARSPIASGWSQARDAPHAGREEQPQANGAGRNRVFDAPFPRGPADILHSLRVADDIDAKRPRPTDKRVWASVEKRARTVIA